MDLAQNVKSRRTSTISATYSRETLQDCLDIMRAQATSGVLVNIPKTCSHDLENAEADIKMLGTYSGPYQAGFLRSKVDKQLALLPRLDHLPAQIALLLLRRSVQPNLHHLLRTVQLLNGDDGFQQIAIL